MTEMEFTIDALQWAREHVTDLSAVAVVEILDEIRRLQGVAQAAEARAEQYKDALHQIDNWAKAYPLDVFPEPDFKQVRAALEAAGITLDSVSASNMRHVIQDVEGMVRKALKGGEE